MSQDNITERNHNCCKKHIAFLVRDDLLAETVVVQMQKRGFYTTIHHTIESLEKELGSKRNPDALIVDQDYFDMRAAKALCHRKESQETILIVLSSEGDIDSRLSAARFNVKNFFHKPTDPIFLADELEKFFMWPDKSIHDIFIVDDDEMTLKLCQRMFEGEGIRIRCSTKPMEVLEHLSKKKPDLILLDYFMPKVNGLDIKRVISQLYDIPVIFMTGTRDPDIVSTLREETGFKPISKPLQKSALISQVDRILV